MASEALSTRFQAAVQAFWEIRRGQLQRQVDAGRVDAGTRGAVTGGGHMAPIEQLVVDLLFEAGLDELEAIDIRTRTNLELPGYYRPTKQWDLLVVAGDQLVTALEFKSMVGSVGKNLNNRVEEAVGSATDVWTAYREGRLGNGPRPFLGYFFLLGDSDDVRRSTTSRSPLFPIDPIFQGASYAERYQILCQRLVAERLYDGACVTLATDEDVTRLTHPAEEVSFARFIAELQGNAYRFVQNRRLDA